MRKTRLPVSLKLATWIITDSVSITNTPPMMNSTTSWRTITAMVPSAAQGQRTDVAHEDLRRIGVEPEEAEAGTDQRAAEDDEFSGTGDVGDQQILGEIHVTGEVTEDADRRPSRSA